jgi:hypothetical protein
MSRLPAAAGVLVAACAAGGSAPPPYHPANTPEAPTACPAESAGAKAAREAAVGSDGADAGGAAAQAVFALAECERRRFDVLDLDTAGLQPEAIRPVREQFRLVEALYQEVTHYRSPRWVLAALARSGDLCVAYAGKVRRMRADPAEVDAIARALDEEAVRAYQRALEVAEAWPGLAAADPEARRWIGSACAGAHGAGRTICR